MEIKRVAVIGSGVMGSAIAAHFANADIPVILMDVVAEGEKRRNALAEKAIERLLATDPAPFTHPNKAHLITPANLEDNLNMLSEVDWVIEAIIEKLEVKHSLYQKIESHRGRSTIVSSNTSTLPLAQLVEGRSDEFKAHFLISHFFNPPRYMRLLELVVGPDTMESCITAVSHCADVKLGKGIVPCNDTPGFIANRIGCYWITTAMLQAIERDISVEEADALMGKPIGVPKTGVFGLMDLIGIDLIPLIAASFNATLPASDPFRAEYQEPALITKMIKDGFTGRKGKGGFYCLEKIEGKKTKKVFNLANGEYQLPQKPALGSIEAGKRGLRALVEYDDKGGDYACEVLVRLLRYAAMLVPEISSDIAAIDNAMKWGYNWKYGPFELIDRLSTSEQSGAVWLVAELKKRQIDVPELLNQVGNGRFYQEGVEHLSVFSIGGEYQDRIAAADAWMLADKKRGRKPIEKNASASLWDIGDGIACLEFTSKMNSIDPYSLEMVEKATARVAQDFIGLVIANDAEHFCVGANIGFALFAANIAAWKTIEDMIKQGQQAYSGLKYAPFPVVVGVSGMALGGGCEILLHADAVQAHVETYAGLVEVGVGVIPGWGGCKEMLHRALEKRKKQKGVAAIARQFEWLNPVKKLNSMPPIIDVFKQIGLAKVSKSAHEAKDMLLLNDKSRITMNRARLLPDAKALCLSLVDHYAPPEPFSLKLPGHSARASFYSTIEDMVRSGKATPHDEVVSKALANVLTGGDTDITSHVDEQTMLALEVAAFMSLIQTEGTLDRIEHMLETGKPLRN